MCNIYNYRESRNQAKVCKKLCSSFAVVLSNSTETLTHYKEFPNKSLFIISAYADFRRSIQQNLLNRCVQGYTKIAENMQLDKEVKT